MRVTGSAFFVRHSIHFYTLIFIHSIHLQKYPCVPSGNSFVCTFKNLVLLLYLIQNPLLSSMAGKQYHLSFAVIEPFQCLFQSLIIIHHKRIVQYDRHGLILAEHLTDRHTQCKVDLLHRAAAHLFQGEQLFRRIDTYFHVCIEKYTGITSFCDLA